MYPTNICMYLTLLNCGNITVNRKVTILTFMKPAISEAKEGGEKIIIDHIQGVGEWI